MIKQFKLIQKKQFELDNLKLIKKKLLRKIKELQIEIPNLIKDLKIK